MAKLAFYTFGILHETRDHPRTNGFADRSPFVYAGAESSDGFVDRAPQRINEEQDPRWGDRLTEPRFIVNEKVTHCRSLQRGNRDKRRDVYRDCQRFCRRED